MKAVVYEKPGRANGRVREIPVPVCGDDQVLMKVMSCGICKPAESSHDRKGSLMGRYPATPGHEFSGVAETVGKNVTHIQPGDRITADNGIPCGSCRYCQKGQFTSCEHFLSQGHNLPGGFSQFLLCRGDKVYRIPDSVSFDSASLCELIGCALNCVDRAELRYGDNVAVIGCGSSGSIIAQLLRHSCAGRVVALDREPSKLERIAKAGVETVLVDPNDLTRHESVLREHFPDGLDVIIDAAGDDGPMFESSIRLLAPRGRYVLYSFFYFEPKTVRLDPGLLIRKDLKITGSPFQMFRFQDCLDALENGKVDSSLVISRAYPLDNYFEALDAVMNDNTVMKVIIHPNE